MSAQMIPPRWATRAYFIPAILCDTRFRYLSLATRTRGRRLNASGERGGLLIRRRVGRTCLREHTCGRILHFGHDFRDAMFDALCARCRTPIRLRYRCAADTIIAGFAL